MTVLYRWRSELLQHPIAIRWLSVAVALFFLSFVFDALTNRSEYLDWLGLEGLVRRIANEGAHAIEEGAKLFAESSLLVGFGGILLALSQRRQA